MRNVIGLMPGAGLPGLAAMWLLAGCSDVTHENNPGEPGMAGSYALRAPFIAFEGRITEPETGAFDLRVVATEGALKLAGDSTYEHRLKFQTFIDDELAGYSNWVDRGDWRLRGDTLHFDSDFIGGLVFRGVKGGRNLSLMQDLVGEGTVAAYPFERNR